MTTTSRKKLNADERRESIAIAAYSIALNLGFNHITRDSVAAAAGCATGLVSRYFPAESLRRVVFRMAIKHENLKILQHNMVGEYAGLVPMPPDLRRKVSESILVK